MNQDELEQKVNDIDKFGISTFQQFAAFKAEIEAKLINESSNTQIEFQKELDKHEQWLGLVDKAIKELRAKLEPPPILRNSTLNNSTTPINAKIPVVAYKRSFWDLFR